MDYKIYAEMTEQHDLVWKLMCNNYSMSLYVCFIYVFVKGVDSIFKNINI